MTQTMTPSVAREWLMDTRTTRNEMPHGDLPPADFLVAVARADAAHTERAYWVLRAHREGLLDEHAVLVDELHDLPVGTPYRLQPEQARDHGEWGTRVADPTVDVGDLVRVRTKSGNDWTGVIAVVLDRAPALGHTYVVMESS